MGCGTEIIANGLDGGVRKKEESKDNFLVLMLSNQQCNNWEHAGRSKFIVENQPFDLALACTCFGIKQPGPHLRIRILLAGWPESACKAGDSGSIPGWERSPGERDRLPTSVFMGFPGGSDGKESACSAGDLDSIPGLGRSLRGEHGNPFQYSCPENPHGQRSLLGYSPWGHKELDMTE